VNTFERSAVFYKVATKVLGAWVVLVVVSVVLFGYLVRRPQIVLWVEELEPSSAYLRGEEELRAGGDLDEAIALFQKGASYFHGLYEENGFGRHYEQWVRGILLSANAYKDNGGAEYTNEAKELYREVIALLPGISQGQAFVSLGELYLEEEDYGSALDLFEEAIPFCESETYLQARFYRGYAQAKSGNRDRAVEDWYYYVRFFYGKTQEWVYDIMYESQEAGHPLADFITGRIAQNRGDTHTARLLLERFLQAYPQDRAAKYYLAVMDGGIYEDEGLLDLEWLLSPGSAEEANNDLFVDIYSTSGLEGLLKAEIEAQDTENEISEVEIWQNGEKIGEWTIQPGGDMAYLVEVSCKKGRTIFFLFIPYFFYVKPDNIASFFA